MSKGMTAVLLIVALFLGYATGSVAPVRAQDCSWHYGCCRSGCGVRYSYDCTYEWCQWEDCSNNLLCIPNWFYHYSDTCLYGLWMECVLTYCPQTWCMW